MQLILFISWICVLSCLLFLFFGCCFLWGSTLQSNNYLDTFKVFLERDFVCKRNYDKMHLKSVSIFYSKFYCTLIINFRFGIVLQLLRNVLIHDKCDTSFWSCHVGSSSIKFNDLFKSRKDFFSFQRGFFYLNS